MLATKVVQLKAGHFHTLHTNSEYQQTKEITWYQSYSSHNRPKNRYWAMPFRVWDCLTWWSGALLAFT